MQYYVYAKTDVGSVREKNEDCVLAGDKIITEGCEGLHCEAPFLAAVCDGVGGEKGGEIASFFVANRLSKASALSVEELKQEIFNVHCDLVDYGNENGELFGLQTTVCCLKASQDGQLYCFNTGDSRMYFYSKGKATQVSKDHTYVQELFEIGEISKDELKTHPKKNVITSSVGNPYQPPKVDVSIVTEFVYENDAVVICSDGVSDFVGECEIEAAMELDIAFEEKISALLQLAVERGSCDNLSVIGVKRS